MAMSGSRTDRGENGIESEKVIALPQHAPALEQNDLQDASIGEEYPGRTRLALLMLSLMLAVFLMALDQSIIATAIPRITDHFHSIDDVGWYASAYLLTTCALQLFFGKLYYFNNIKWVFLSTILIFEIGSAVCGAAPTSTVLVVGRAIAGLGSAGIFSGALIMIAHAVPVPKRPLYLALIGSMYGIASVAGPLLGGALTNNVSWRWCFYINLPIGSVTLICVALFYTPPRTRAHYSTVIQELKALDLPGTVLFIPGVVCSLLALQWGGTTYAWSNWRIIILFLFFGLLIIAFVAVQAWQQEKATVPPRIFNQRSVIAASWFTFCLGGSFFTFIYYVPIWLQAVKNDSPVASGIHSIPMLLSSVVAILISGALVTKYGYIAPFIVLSSVLMTIGAGLITTWQPGTASGQWIGYQILYGLGVGAGLQQGVISVQSALPIADVSIGTAIIMFAQLFGGALFASISQSVFTNHLIRDATGRFPNVNPLAILGAGATGITGLVPPEDLPALLEIYNSALRNAFIVGLTMAALSVLGSMFIRWQKIEQKLGM